MRRSGHRHDHRDGGGDRGHRTRTGPPGRRRRGRRSRSRDGPRLPRGCRRRHDGGSDGGDVLAAAGAAFSEAAGGASGALWGAGLSAAGEELAARTAPEAAPGVRRPESPEFGKVTVADVHAALEAAPGARLLEGPEFGGATVADVHAALEAALAAVTTLGGAVAGDKTMVDALAPFVAAFGRSRHTSLTAVWREAADVAAEAAAGTAGLAGRKGRAAVHGVRSVGTPDPGAVSLAAALGAGGKVLERVLEEGR
ncbi:DAK2 domain-containing protein [Acrocarpospora corrugata]|uniref:DAK2 domain-containing protein n=1 Tax=Acrocarpospora corrugata TaxID=35763 RepID=UPI003CD094BB